MIDSSGPLISIIIPVYNVEKYLHRCINSVVNQTYKNLEIILVDDGSPDNCPALCDEWAKKDSRIIVLHKQNGGLSSARNFAFSHSKGELISYVDSDDFISSVYIEKLYEMLIQNNADISCVSYDPIQTENFIPKPDDFEYPVFVMDGKEACKELFTTQKVSTMAWAKLYKRQEVKQFPDGRNYEDSATICKFLYTSKKIASSKMPLYYVNSVNENSICHTKSFKNLDDSIWAGMERARFFNSVNEKELAEYAWNYIGGDMINTFIDYPIYCRKWKHYVKEFFRESSAPLFLKLKLQLALHFPRMYKKIKSSR